MLQIITINAASLIPIHDDSKWGESPSIQDNKKGCAKVGPQSPVESLSCSSLIIAQGKVSLEIVESNIRVHKTEIGSGFEFHESNNRR